MSTTLKVEENASAPFRPCDNPIAFPFPLQIADGREVSVHLWRPSIRLPGTAMGFDTETELIVPGKVPDVAMMQVYDNEGSCYLIHPHDIAEFMSLHMEVHWVGHNVGFDFWVLAKHLHSCRPELYEAWWDVVEEGRMHDSMLLERLLALARMDDPPNAYRTLGMVAAKFAGMEIDKEDPYRMRYGELLGVPLDEWVKAEPGFFTYAAKDPIATLNVYDEIRRQIREYVQPSFDPRWGPLSEAIQVKSAIVTATMERMGIGVDRAQVVHLHAAMKNRSDSMMRLLEELATPLLEEGKTIFRTRKKTGEFILTKSGAVSRNAKVFKTQVLGSIVREFDELQPPTLKDGTYTDAVSYWEAYMHLHPIIKVYCDWQHETKLMQFLQALETERIHPRYSVMVRTGRTSCSSPNLQQLPRKSDFRKLIKAETGYYFLAIDYSAVELRTLAQVCLDRFGFSKLAEVFQAGGDPHTHTAKMLVPNFDELGKVDQKAARQKAKVINFGIPGSLGAASLVDFARTAYDVVMTQEEAEALRDKLIYEIYPELALFLGDDLFGTIAANIGCDENKVKNAFSKQSFAAAARRIIAGKTERRDGEPYDPAFVDKIWETMLSLSNGVNDYLSSKFHDREGDERLSRRVFNGSVVTATGRIRGHVGYSQRCNTQFQGLAADGAKLAMFRLVRLGYRLVGFVHDEMMLELPVQCDHELHCNQIQQILIDSMREVTPSIPIECEWLLADRWYKGVDANERDEHGRLIPYREEVQLGTGNAGAYDEESIKSFVVPEKDESVPWDAPVREEQPKEPMVPTFVEWFEERKDKILETLGITMDQIVELKTKEGMEKIDPRDITVGEIVDEQRLINAEEEVAYLHKQVKQGDEKEKSLLKQLGPFRCKACSGTGKNSKGKKCAPCSGKGLIDLDKLTAPYTTCTKTGKQESLASKKDNCHCYNCLLEYKKRIPSNVEMQEATEKIRLKEQADAIEDAPLVPPLDQDVVAAVDPGWSGGIAIKNLKTDVVTLYDMPKTPREIVEFFRDHMPKEVKIEDVKPVQGDLPKTAWHLGGSRYTIETALAGLGIAREYVSIAKWQRACKVYGMKTPKGEAISGHPKKKIHQERANEYFPRTKKITLKTCDAALILHYCYERNKEDE